MATRSFDDHYYDVPDLRDAVARFGLVGALERVNSQAIHPDLPALRSCWREASTQHQFGGVPRLTSLEIHLATTAPVRQTA
ncbi:hypothetical protein LX15_002771 [Streptoalloteichus tenebrarius]|uniref:Uncharacterized protein n=1 Tax=Streptoalloteichus tenebrarius (strain ATCC 17920 / DSM 40477 / JCM 4838 / CBS 697.72 / NBRC 16177 / NCIMB 11028 / NRRL B-12390 / A12253. 1 / ISP 5477) TaxID=1933 RepID=A0ABT1HUG6_STRSD|nr:hypothetical protein [Streptoalloteichus tenebrarius]MCP2259070.1 hypothetical protein [Streptoalloteichus tenebrarius]